MKITVYTVSDCQFSKAEKDYLKLHNIPFEEKNLEQNREWLTEMLAVSNNFAGTPVTKIEKDDGSIVVLKGFTKEEFDKELGFGQEPATKANAQVNLSQSPETKPQPQTPVSTPPPQETQPLSTSTSTPPLSPSQPPTTSQPLTSTTAPTDQSTNQPPANMNQSQNQSPSSTTPSPSENNQTATDQLNTILSDLQNKSQSQISETPTNLPNIPDFEDKS